MQIMVLETFDSFGHMVSKVDKGILSKALAETKDALTPSTQPAEVIVYQPPEADLELGCDVYC